VKDEKETDSSGKIDEGRDPRFPDTRWSLVSDIRKGSEGERERALSDLCRIYWFPIYAFARSKGCEVHLAEDLTQELFLKFVSRESFANADKSRGRMRTYLLTTLNNLIVDNIRRRTVAKRSPGNSAVSIERDIAEGMLADRRKSHAPEEEFDRHWAEAILREVELRLAAEFTARGKGDQFHALKPFLLPTSSEDGYAEIAEELEMAEGTVKVAVFRLRKRFKTLMREEIENTITEGENADDELRYLYSALARAGVAG